MPPGAPLQGKKKGGNKTCSGIHVVIMGLHVRIPFCDDPDMTSCSSLEDLPRLLLEGVASSFR